MTHQIHLIGNPDLGTEDLCFGNSRWLIPTTKTIDEMVSAVDPHPKLNGTIVISQRRCFSQWDWRLFPVF